jgi:hypothetical protein
MTNVATISPIRFDTKTTLALEATFDGGRITSDGGLPWLAQLDSELGLCESLAACVPESGAGARLLTLWRTWCASACCR